MFSTDFRAESWSVHAERHERVQIIESFMPVAVLDRSPIFEKFMPKLAPFMQIIESFMQIIDFDGKT